MQIKSIKPYKFEIAFGLLLFLLFLISGIIAPKAVERQKENWDEILEEKVLAAANLIQETVDKKSGQVLNAAMELKSALRESFNNNIFQNNALEILNNNRYASYCIQLFDDENNLIAWNSESVIDSIYNNSEKLKIAQTFFYEKNLFTYISIIDTISARGAKFILICSLPIEKHYRLGSIEGASANLTDSLSQYLSTEVQIDYLPEVPLSKDGRKYSFSIMNNYKNKIGVATFAKPTIDFHLNQTRTDFNLIQRFAVLLFVLVLGISFRNSFNHNRIIKLLLAAFYLIIIRTLLFVFEIPSSFYRSELTDPANFSSKFAFGMMRSPLEFFITLIFLLAVVLIAFNYTTDLYNKSVNKSRKNLTLFLLTAPAVFFLLLMLWRGFGASIRSVIFDSSIRYFKYFSLVPSPTVFLMCFNILAVGLIIFIVSVILLMILFRINPYADKNNSKLLFIIIFLLVQIFGWLFDLLQIEPQGTHLIRVVFITLLFFLIYNLLGKREHWFKNMIYKTLAASIVSVSLLIHYNSEIEKESLKTTAHELLRVNEDLVEFIVLQTLNNVEQNPRIIDAYLLNKNFSSEAFIIWTKSLFYREAIPSGINFFDSQKKYLGGFNTTEDFSNERNKKILKKNSSKLEIYRDKKIFGEEKRYDGVLPVSENGRIIGYVVVTAIHNEGYFNFAKLPGFLLASRAGISSAVDLEKLNIFDFENNILIRSFGGISLSKQEEQLILDAKFTIENETWAHFDFNKEPHLVYLLKREQNGKQKIMAVARQEKGLSWNLSDFFKIFFVHSIIVLFFIAVISFLQFQKTRLALSSYRTKIVAAFLIVSIIPLIIIAIYFRNLTEKGNTELIKKRLYEISLQLNNYLRSYNNFTTVADKLLFEKASSDLSINYSIYSGADNIFSSSRVFNEVGLFSAKINGSAFLNCQLGGYSSFYTLLNFEGQKIISYYSKLNIAGREYIFEANNLFNNITLSLSDTELDIFLFGIFSFAGLSIIVFSAMLAGQISLPIRKLTRATRAVAGGDFNIEVLNNRRGEIKELIDGFNMMVKKIKKSQSDIAHFEREEAWKEMAKQVAHEIKNPLTPMKLSVQQLITAYNDRTQKFDSIFEKVTSTIVSQIETLKNIASEFSNFARMPKMNIEQLNIVSAVQETINLFSDEKLEISSDNSHPQIIINADQDHLKRTFVNLIRNAIQANAAKILVKIEKKEEYCEIRIIDNGEGIDNLHLEKIFDESFTTKKSGMGLGLSLAKRFIESINGEIFVENTSSLGTTFLIKIPLTEK